MTSRFPPGGGAPGSKERDDTVDAAGNSVIAPAVPSYVIYKLLGFTFAIFTLPIGMYFATVNLVFRGNSTYAGATAAIVANVVLIAYVIVAMNEDQSEQLAAKEKEKKTS